MALSPSAIQPPAKAAVGTQAWLPGLEAPMRGAPAPAPAVAQPKTPAPSGSTSVLTSAPLSAPLFAPQPVAAPPALSKNFQPPLVQGIGVLHPALWRADQLGRHDQAVQSSGFAELDAQLPGGGWPAQVLTELLLPHPGVGELRLLAPVLASVQQQQRCVMWFDPPALPCAWTLGALGIDVRQLVLVHAKQVLKSRARQLLPAADILWAVEQALKSGHVGVLLAWLPGRLPADALRRLQLAAQAHQGPMFLLRDAPVHLRAAGARAVVNAMPPSPAPLRLLLGNAGPDVLTVRVLKRRGPPLADTLTLALPPVLSQPALDPAWQIATAAAMHEHPGF